MRPLFLAMLLTAASASAWEEPFERVLQFSRLRRQMAEALNTLPDYTCLVTTERTIQKPKDRDFKKLDVLRYEIAHIGKNELWSWPGEKQFHDGSFGAMIENGTISDGDFALHARNIFVHDNGNVKFAGAEDLGGRATLRWNYQVPSLQSGWLISSSGASERVSERGSFWVDADTLQVIRLEIHAAELPPGFSVTSARDIIDYAPTHIGLRTVLLPQTAFLELGHRSGEMSRNITEFSHCRQYQGSSEISFEAAPPKASDVSIEPEKLVEVTLPGAVPVRIRIATTIDSSKAVIGSVVDGTVDGDIAYRGKVLVPKGARITGRLRRAEKQKDSFTYFIVGIEFDDIAFPGHHARFFGRFKSMQEELPAFNTVLERSKTMEGALPGGGSFSSVKSESLHLWEQVPGVATFFMEGNSFRIPAGTVMLWETQDLKTK